MEIDLNKLIEQLSRRFDLEGVSLALKEYRLSKAAFKAQKWEDVVKHSAIFSEAIIGLLVKSELRIGIDYNAIRFNDMFLELLKAKVGGPTSEILLKVIPQVAKSIYMLRNKKRVVHLKLIDPTYLDAHYCITAIDWIIAQLLTTSTDEANEQEAWSLIQKITEEELPFMEIFEDGTVMIYPDDLSLKDRVLLVLYLKYPNRIPTNELLNTIIHEGKKESIRATLSRLWKEKLIHRNEQGVILTKKGIRYVEEKILRRNINV